MSTLDRIYALEASGAIDEALDVLFEHMDDLMRDPSEGAYAFLDAVDVTRLKEDLIVGFLSITYPVKHWPSRIRLFERASAHLYKIAGPERDVEQMLRGLS